MEIETQHEQTENIAEVPPKSSTTHEGRPLELLLTNQQQAFLKNPNPPLENRILILKKLQKLLLDNQKPLIIAMANDFGGRSQYESLFAEFMPIIEGIKYTLKRLRKWMKPSKRHTSIQLQPASAHVVYQPLGIIGIIVPWNYPLLLSISPLITALAAGNRAMIKMSEYTPETSTLIAKIINNEFPEDQIAVITGETDVAAAFSKLPFDHLIFTGSTQVGRHVMSAAAKNLTPVTLELGGKSPAIVDNNFPINKTARRICFGKSINSGQTCIAPDYVLIHKEQQDDFVKAYIKAFNKMYPKLNNNDDYSSIINDKQYQRLQNIFDDAKDKGAKIIQVTTEIIEDGSRRMPPTIILYPKENMKVMQEEIFGPILPIIIINSLDDAIRYIQSRPRPLALYYFGKDKIRQQKVINETHSGGVTINDTLMHIAVDDMPFGGIGPSGMGHYHGHEGFLSLTKAKAILTKGKVNSTQIIYPPFNTFLKKTVIKFMSTPKSK